MVMGLGEVPQLEVDQACEEREAALDRKLKDWERKLVARNESWPDNPRSAAPRAAQDLVDSKRNRTHNSDQTILEPVCQKHHTKSYLQGTRLLLLPKTTLSSSIMCLQSSRYCDQFEYSAEL